MRITVRCDRWHIHKHCRISGGDPKTGGVTVGAKGVIWGTADEAGGLMGDGAEDWEGPLSMAGGQ